MRRTVKSGAGAGEGASPMVPIPSRYVTPKEGGQRRTRAPCEPQGVESRSSIACAGWMLEGELVSMYIRIWLRVCVCFVFPVPVVGVTLP